MASEVDICNGALAYLGQSPISVLDNSSKTSRACRAFFDSSRDYLISLFDWPFARGVRKLEALEDGAVEVPSAHYAYPLPADCLVPRYIHPKGTRRVWDVIGPNIVTTVAPLYLYYTRKVTVSGRFSPGFISALELYLASRVCMSITADKTLKNALSEEFGSTLTYVIGTEANVGNEYIHHDQNPDSDTFVSPEYDRVAYYDFEE